jgi:hypothetical protein
MKINVGTMDRAGRAMLALILLRLALKKPSKLNVLAAFSGGQLLSSALSGYCPLYELFKISTVGKPI